MAEGDRAVPVVVTGSDMITSLGDTAETLNALRKGLTGNGPLRFYDSSRLEVTRGYHVNDGESERPLRASGWLAQCVSEAVRQSGIDPAAQRVSVIVGSALRELRAFECWALDGAPLRRDHLHFDAAVRAVLPEAAEVVTLSNACSASGHALALAQDLLAGEEAEAVVVAGCDAMSESMLTMIGRLTEGQTAMVQPFQSGRVGALIGEGAAAVVLQPATTATRAAQAELLGTGMTCDAYHETVPHPAGIVAAMRDAHRRAAVRPQDIGLVLAHGTGTLLNEPVEAAALGAVYGDVTPGPLVTGIKGALGHTSGSAALMSLIVAADALRTGLVPPIVGLDDPIEEAAHLRLVTGEPESSAARVAQVNAFGFGGINAVTVIRVDAAF